jgi:SAM-dependent methyltransferase
MIKYLGAMLLASHIAWGSEKGFDMKNEKDELKVSIYYATEANQYSKISLLGEGTLFLAFRDFGELIRCHLPNRSFDDIKAIDYGCGAGRSTRYLKHLGVKQVDGFDISKEMITEAKFFDKDGRYEKIQSGSVPVADAIYDLALLSFVTVAIETKSELVKIFQELSRTLKKDGMVMSLALSEAFWNPKRHWVTYKQDYPENDHPVSGQKSRLTITSINMEITDTYWLESDVIDCAQQAGLSFVKKHHSLGKPEDGISWQDETTYAPYTILLFKKI